MVDARISSSCLRFCRVGSHLPGACSQYEESDLKVYSDRGLFTEIGRAWITIDNVLYLWNFRKDGPGYVNIQYRASGFFHWPSLMVVVVVHLGRVMRTRTLIRSFYAWH